MNIINQINKINEYCNNNYIVYYPAIKIKYNGSNATFVNAPFTNNKIIFEKEDTLKTAIKYNHLNPVVLILADEYSPGGTYISNCQEETLFRRTALFAHMKKSLYPINMDELIYAKSVAVFSETEPIIDFSIKYRFDFIALPSVRNLTNYNDISPGLLVSEIENNTINIMKNKLRLLFDTVKRNNNNTIILGAMGCGAFGCKPEIVANIMKKVISEYSDLIIIFSILGANYNVFNAILME